MNRERRPFRHDAEAHGDQLRVPPHSTEAEQAVLGGIMLVGQYPNWAYDEIAELLDESSFYRRDHQLIFRAIVELANKSRPVDAVTLAEWFDSMGLGEQVAGGGYLIELASTTPSAANIRAYAEIVADKARKRRLIDAGTAMVSDALASEGRSSLDLIGEAMTRVGALLDAQPSEVSPIEIAMNSVFQELYQRNSAGSGMDGMPTGFADYDEILGGLVPGVHFLAGRPKHGKSTLAQNIAEYVALELKRPVHIVILEMSEQQFAKRVISSIGFVDSQRMRRGTLDDADWAAVSGAVSRMRGAPMYISKPGSTRIQHICAQIRKQHAKTKLGLAVIDYLQLIDIETAKGENTSTAIGRVTRALVNLAQELGIPILCLSQLSRKSEDDGRPKPSHLRDSGAIEADAESVTLVYREEVNNPATKFAGTMEVNVALNRNGPPGTCRLLFRGDRYRCETLPLDWEPAHVADAEDRPKRGFNKGRAKPDSKQAAAGGGE